MDIGLRRYSTFKCNRRVNAFSAQPRRGGGGGATRSVATPLRETAVNNFKKQHVPIQKTTEREMDNKIVSNS